MCGGSWVRSDGGASGTNLFKVLAMGWGCHGFALSVSNRHCVPLCLLCRYTVQQKLVDFMAPVVMEQPQFTAQLFANLFGHSGR